MLDDRFLRLFDDDPEKAVERYTSLRQRLVFYFARRRCNDPEDLADEVISRAIAALEKGATITTTIEGFCFGIARNVWLEQFHEPEVQPVEENDLPPAHRPRRGLSASDSRILLRECLAMLPSEERDLLVRYHLQDRKALARERGKSENALRVDISRIKGRLLEKIKGTKKPPG